MQQDQSKKDTLSNPSTSRSEEPKKSDQQRSDPPLTEIKGVTDPEEYVEPPVEDESVDKKPGKESDR